MKEKNKKNHAGSENHNTHIPLMKGKWNAF
jgi:hypothetical protein